MLHHQSHTLHLIIAITCAIMTHAGYAATQQSASSAEAKRFAALRATAEMTAEVVGKRSEAAPRVRTSGVSKSKPRTSSQAKLIGEELTPSNALFPRTMYGKDQHNKEVELRTITRTLFIFFDDYEDAGDRVSTETYDVLQALESQACPFLVSAKLLHNIFGRKHAITRDQVRNFDPSKWVIITPEPSKSLFLFIPKRSIDRRIIGGSKSLHTIQAISALRVNAEHIIADNYHSWMKRFTATFAEYNSLDGLKNILKEPDLLFVPHKHYRELGQAVPQWVICLTGHGGPTHKVVAGMPYGAFQDLLSFLDTKITTKLFFYATCYASGTGRQDIYKEEVGGFGKQTYTFPIIATGIADAAFVRTERNFRDIIKFVESEEPTPYIAIAVALSPAMYPFVPHALLSGLQATSHYDQRDAIASFPVIRLPGKHHFLPFLEEVHISQIMTLTRESVLAVAAYAQQQHARIFGIPQSQAPKILEHIPLLITVHPFHVPFGLEINRTSQNDRILLISTNNEVSTHYFSAISTNYSLDPALWEQSFWSIFVPLDYARQGWFFIKRLTYKNPSSAHHSKTTPTTVHDVLVRIHLQDGTERVTVYFTDDKGAAYTFNSTNTKSTLVTKDSDRETYYNSLHNLKGPASMHDAQIRGVRQSLQDTLEKHLKRSLFKRPKARL